MDLNFNGVGYFWLILTQVQKMDCMKQSHFHDSGHISTSPKEKLSQMIDIVDWWPGKVCGWPKQQLVVIECDTVARKRWLL